MIHYLFRGIRNTFAPSHWMGRFAMHAIATIIGAIACIRLTWGAPLWESAVVYVAFFVFAHIACVPFMTVAAIALDATDRWVRSIIEEELIRFDLRTYQRQLIRVFPEHAPPDKHDH